MAQILIAGETLIDFVPAVSGPIDSVETFHRRAGGAPANVAVALATLGAPPQFWTRVGDMSRAGEADGPIVSFDPNARPELFEAVDFETVCARAITHADVVKATADDLTAAGVVEPGVTDAGTLARAVCEQEHGPHTALITRGRDGALARATPAAPWNPTAEPLVVDHEGYDVDPVDTTGAGDAFTAGAIAALSVCRRPASKG